MPKLTASQAAALRAAQRGDLLHSVYEGYDWVALNVEDMTGGGRVTRTVQRLVALGLVELLPRQRGDEHRGQPYKLTPDGEAVLAGVDSDLTQATPEE